MKILQAPLYSNRQLFWLVLLVCAGLVFGYFSGSWHGQQLSGEAELLRYQNETMRERLHELEYQNNILQVERDVAEQANSNLQAEYQALLQERDAIQRELTFYQRVVAPDTRDGLVVDSARLAPLDAEHEFYVRLVVLQHGSVHQALTAQLEVELHGKNSEGAAGVLNLAELADLPAEFGVTYFELLEGTFTLPVGWEPEHIQVTLSYGNQQQHQETFNWSELITAGGHS